MGFLAHAAVGNSLEPAMSAERTSPASSSGRHHRADMASSSDDIPPALAATFGHGAGGGGGGAVAIASALDCKVLVLNKLYVAIRVISAKRAFSMLACNLAE